MSAAAPARAKTPALPRPLSRAIPVRAALASVFVLSTAGHAVLAWLRPMPSLFPDEYLYASLGRSLIHTGRPLVRGGDAHFPALLQPILTAPVWLFDDVNVGYRLLQGVNAAAISLAVVPVYLIARRLRLGTWVSVGLAALAVAGPQLLFAGAILAEPFSYPLLLGAVAAAIALLEQPTRRRGILFVVLALLAAFARVQLAIVPACTLLAAVALGLRERRLRQVLREQRYVVGLVGVELAAAGLLAATHHLGYYQRLLPSGVDPLGALHVTGANVYVLLLSTGCALAPAAAVGWALALVRPRTRGEFAFAALTTALLLAILAQCALYGDTHLVQERYLFYIVPLIAVCFGLRVSRGSRRWLVEAATGAALVLAALALPLAGYAHSSQQSVAPFLFGVVRLEFLVGGGPGNASLLVALAATVLVGAAVAAAVRPRWGTPAIVALSLAASLAALSGGFSFDRLADLRIRHIFLPADRSWVDHARVGRVTYLAATGTSRNPAQATMFWNPSIDRLVRLPATAPVDKFAQSRADIALDGTIRVDGRALTGALLTDEQQATVRLRGARAVARWNVQTLWVPHGRARLASVFVGRHADGRLESEGALLLWPGTRRTAGWLELRVAAGAGVAHGGLSFYRSNGPRIPLLVRGGGARGFRVPLCTDGPWQAGYSTVPKRSAAVSVGVPRFVPDPSACP